MPKLTWKKLKARFPNLPAHQQVSLIKTLDSGQEEAVFEGLMPLGEAILEPLTAAVKKVEGLRSYLVSVSFEPGLYAILLHERGEAAPEGLDPMLASCFRYAPLSRERLSAAILALPQARREDIAWRALDDYNPRETAEDVARWLGPELAFSGLLVRLDKKEAKYFNGNSETNFIQAFQRLGPTRWALAAAAVEGKCSTRAARMLLHAAEGQAPEAGSAGLLVALLGFSNKGVRAEAQKALEGLLAEHAEALRPALEAGLEARGKLQREACAALLALLEEGGAPAEALPAPLAEAVSAREHLSVKAAIDRGGAVGLLAEREHCKLTGSAWEWEKRMRDNGSSEQAAWVAVWLFAQLPSGGKKWSLHRFRDAMSRLYGKKMLPALRWVLTSSEPAHAGPLYELLAKHEGAEIDPALWIPALDASQKSTRELAVQQLGKLPPSLAPQLMPLLKSRRKATREAVAQLLVQHPPQDAAALEAALEKEDVLEVAQHLRAALAELAPAAPADPEAPSEAALIERLEGVRKKRAPKWLDLSALPELRLTSGAGLSDTALAGLLALLSLEGPEHHDLALKAAAGLFEAESAAAWTLAVLDAWAAAAKKSPSWRAGRRDALTGPSAHKWAVFQQAFFIDEARVEALRDFLGGGFASNNHHYVSWCLSVLERRGLPLAEDVLIERAVMADRDTERGQARELLQALAQREGCPPIALVQRASVSRPRVQRDPHPGADAKAQRHLLEWQMTNRNLWSKAQVQDLLLGKGAYAAQAQAVVFRVSDGTLVRPSGPTLITLAGAPRPLAEGETLAVPHILEMTNAELDSWSAHLDAAGLTQPFEQLRRPYRLADRDRFVRAEDIPPYRFQRVAEALGWDLSARDGYGANSEARLFFPARGTKVALEHGEVGPWLKDPIALTALRFTDLLDQALRPEDVDPVAYSEGLMAAERVS